MELEILLRFIQRIISTSVDVRQSVEALRELQSILKKQGIPETHLDLIESAIRGTDDSLPAMQSSVSSLPALSPGDLQDAVTRAHEAKLREEERMRMGRC